MKILTLSSLGPGNMLCSTLHYLMRMSNNSGNKVVQFQVKADSDACILLPHCDGCDGYEIVIGGWDNTQSVIRDKKGQPHPGHAVTQVGCNNCD